jgi:hypothetical protein
MENPTIKPSNLLITAPPPPKRGEDKLNNTIQPSRTWVAAMDLFHIPHKIKGYQRHSYKHWCIIK